MPTTEFMSSQFLALKSRDLCPEYIVEAQYKHFSAQASTSEKKHRYFPRISIVKTLHNFVRAKNMAIKLKSLLTILDVVSLMQLETRTRWLFEKFVLSTYVQAERSYI